ncbi:SusC/RagA family TonB-linked outer membrane protein [Mucilaginibacter sp.]|uniref:SusC/RagA family TonB-linked outer membrane protein n=1 Tax=Mucilaginibacter sp. TaxID=1882438 RepID=UPI003267F4AF
MKLKILLIVVINTLAILPAVAQNKISLNLKNADFKKVLKSIEKQSDYHFVYSESKIPVNKKVTINVQNVEVTGVLDEVFANTGYTYKKLANNLIVILLAGEQINTGKAIGQVVDENDNPLPGASIQIKKTSFTTITDNNGDFTIVAPDNSVLVVTYVGYNTVEIPYDETAILTIRMSPNDKALNEVVVTALGLNKEERRLGYSITQLSGNEVSETRETTFINALAGKVAGLTVQSPPNGPGGSSRIILRGYSSFSGSNQPLYVVDGVPINSSTKENTEEPLKVFGGSDPGDGLSSINPDDIESISILKGASAAALYGGGAQGGVILISTKKGLKSPGVGIAFNSNTVMEKMIPYDSFQYEYGRGNNGKLYTVADNISNSNYLTGQSWGVKFAGQQALGADGKVEPYEPQTIRERFNKLYQNGITTTNSLAFAKTTDNNSFRISLSQTKNNTPTPGSGYERYNGVLRFVQDFGSKIHTDFKVDLSKTMRTNAPLLRGDDRGSFSKYFIRSDNVTDIDFLNQKDTNGNYLYVYTNPYIQLQKVINNQTQNRVLSAANITYDISSHFHFNLIGGLDYVGTDGLFVNFPNNKNGNGTINNSTITQRRSDVRALLNYDRTFADFSVSAFAGTEFQKSTFSSLNITGTGLTGPTSTNLNNTTIGLPVQVSTPRSKTNAIFGATQLGYKNFLFLEVTARNDWYSALSSVRPGFVNHIFYPSANLSYIFSDAFRINPKVLSFGKLRLSVGQTGSNPNPNQTDLSFKYTETVNNIPGQQISNTSLPPSSLKPETTTETEIGTELKFFKDLFYLDVAWYNKKSKNFLLPVTLPTTTGFNSTYQNAGSMINRGLEIMLNGTAIKTKNFSWNIIVTYAHNNNKVTTLSDALGTNGVAFYYTIKAKAGYPLGSIFGTPLRRDGNGNLLYKAVSIDGSNVKAAVVIDKGALSYDGNGNPVKNAAGALVVDNETYLGNVNPDWSGGITNTFRYKNFRFSFLIDGQFGGKIFEDGARWANFFGNSRATLLGRDGTYIPQGMVNTGTDAAPVYVKNTLPYSPYQQYNSFASLAYYADEMSVFSRTFIKFRQISLGYSFPKKILSATPVKSATFSLIARNLFFIRKDLPIFDPESSDSIGNGYGYDTGGLPGSRTFGFNLSVSF